MVTIVVISVFVVMIASIIAIAKMPESKAPKREPIQPISKSKELTNSHKKSSLFVEDYTLLDFVREFGPKMQIGEHTYNDKVFHTCRFIKPNGDITDVRFFSQLGELTKEQIRNRKDELFVGKMKSGRYYLHDENMKEWEEVDFSLL